MEPWLCANTTSMSKVPLTLGPPLVLLTPTVTVTLPAASGAVSVALAPDAWIVPADVDHPY